MVCEMRADVGILCALREHMSYLLSVSTPLCRRGDFSLVEYSGQTWAIGHQGRTDGLSCHNAWRLIETFSPSVLYTFGPSASLTPTNQLGVWHAATRCVVLTEDLAFESELVAASPPGSTLWGEARLMISARAFIANAAVVRQLVQRRGDAVTLLDMTGHGVARVSAEVNVPWLHFRWTTDRAGDTAVSQFVWNVRDLAKRGHEVLRILQEVSNGANAVI